MNMIEQRKKFEETKKVYESAKLKFHGVEGFDVYNPSIPFVWNGKKYIYGRVEKREEWARSWVRLFENTGEDDWTLVPNSMIYQLEDPYISIIEKELVLGGTHVRYEQGKIATFYGYFYKGTELDNLYYFTTGPNLMKDIRLVQLSDKRIGVFSRPRSKKVLEKYGSYSLIGFTIINSINDLTADVIENAANIYGIFDIKEWGGCNQAYLLDSGLIGIIGHKCYKYMDEKDTEVSVYLNMAFVFDPIKHEASEIKIIGTRPCYPEGPEKLPGLFDTAFTSGIVMREDGKADLYSGLGDAEAGRITIDYPFEGYGKIV